MPKPVHNSACFPPIRTISKGKRMTEQPASSKQHQPQKRPFNLLLVMSLLALAGIVAYLALSHYYPATADSNAPTTSGNNGGDPELARFELDAQVQSLQPITEALEAYYLGHGQWPQELTQLGLDELQSYPSLQLEPNGRLAFSGSSALGEYANHRIYLEAESTPDKAGFNWRCSAPGIPEAYLPDYCME